MYHSNKHGVYYDSEAAKKRNRREQDSNLRGRTQQINLNRIQVIAEVSIAALNLSQ